jgi:hypothetical protein
MQKHASEMKIVTFTVFIAVLLHFIVLFYFILFHTVLRSFNNDVQMYIDEGTNKPYKNQIKNNQKCVSFCFIMRCFNDQRAIKI